MRKFSQPILVGRIFWICLGILTAVHTSLHSCDPPLSTTVFGQSTTTATVQWLPGEPNASGYDLLLLPCAAAAPSVTATPDVIGHSNSQFTFNNLTAGTCYAAYVRTRCGATFGAWVRQNFFTVVNNTDVCRLNLPIPDVDCAEVDVRVQNAPGTALGNDVFLESVDLIVFHEWDADLDIELRSPGGVIVELTTDNGSGQNHYGNPADTLCQQITRFVNPAVAADCQTPLVSNGVAPFIGDFLPEGNLSDFHDGTTNPNGDWTLLVCDDAADSTGYVAHVRLNFVSNVCPRPEAVSVTQTDSTSVLLEWAGGGCGTALVEYGPVGFAPGTGATPGGGDTISVSGCPYAVTGLDPSTTYEFYVRNRCDGNYSGNSCAVAATTTCSPGTPTLVADFSDEANCLPFCGESCPLDGFWQNANDDDQDWLVHNGSTPTFLTGPVAEPSGLTSGKYVYLESSNACSPNRTATLMSNCVLVQSQGQGCDMSFDYHFNGFQMGSLRLQVSADGTNWTTIFENTARQGNDWVSVFVDLNPWHGQTVRFRFVGTSGAFGFSDIGLDNLQFYGSVSAPAAQRYYADSDGDGYGRTDDFVELCAAAPPPGYAVLNGDCDDTNDQIYPTAPETPCNGISESCGTTPDAELPTAAPQTVPTCENNSIALQRAAEYGGQIFWYDTFTGGNLLHVGATYVPNNLPTNASDTTLVIEYFTYEQTNAGCGSAERSPFRVEILPTPDLSIATFLPSVCPGTTVDLLSTGPADARGLNGMLTFHAGSPASAPLPDPFVSANGNQTYFIQKTTAGGCADVVSFPLEVLPAPEAAIDAPAAVCPGEGALLVASDVANNAPQPAYAYQWSTGDQTPSTQFGGHPTAGTNLLFSVTLTNGAGCSDTLFQQIAVQEGLSQFSRSIQPVSDCDAADGSITIAPVGGTAPYQLTWMGSTGSGQSGDFSDAFTIENLEEGNYTLELSDSQTSGCPLIIENNVVSGPAVQVEDLLTENVSCHGAADGALEVNVSTPGVGYLWSNGATTERIENLPSGTYAVTITSPDCSTVLNNLIVGQPPALNALARPQNPFCADGDEGQILLNLTGGTGSYSVLWNDGTTGAIRTDLGADDYWATVTDQNGCTLLTDTFSLIAPPPPVGVVAQQQDVTCFGEANGAVVLTGTDGAAPYQFLWEDGSTAAVRDGLVGGFYVPTITDANGCTAQIPIFIEAPDTLTLSVQTVPESCTGSGDALLTPLVGGGNGAYQFVWNDGSTDSLRSGLSSGFFSLTVTDAKGCQVNSGEQMIEAPAGFSVQVAVNDPSCLGRADGALEVAPSGGAGPYQVVWSDGVTGSIRSQLGSGDYRYTVTDENGCVQIDSVTLAGTQVLTTSSSVVSPDCAGQAAGMIMVSAMNGTPNYQYIWSNGATTDNLDGLTAGDYQLTVTDALGCRLETDTFHLTETAPLVVEMVAVDPINCSGEATGSVQAVASGGTGDYQFLWSNGATTSSIGQLAAGAYQLTVNDANNCFATSSVVTLVSNPPVEAQIEFLQSPNNACENTLFDTIRVTPVGGVGPYELQWSDGGTAFERANLPSGDYGFTLTDANGCTDAVTDLKVTEPAPVLQIALTSFPPATDDCTEPETMVQAVINGGAAPFQLNWSDGQLVTSTSDSMVQRAVDESNFYTLTITDSQGCVSESSPLFVEVLQPPALFVPADSIQPVACKGTPTGKVFPTLEGGLAPFTYEWRDSSSDLIGADLNLLHVPAGLYQLRTTDARGCVDSVTVEVWEPAVDLGLAAPAQVQNATCEDTQDGSIQLNVEGGHPPYQYRWTDNEGNTVGTSEDLSLIPAGVYALEVIDQEDCALYPVPLEVRAPVPVVATSVMTNDATCFGDEDGSIAVTLAPDTAVLTLNWFRDGFLQPDLNGNLSVAGQPAGTYTLRASYNFVCSYQFTDLVIEEPDELVVFSVNVQPASSATATDGRAAIIANGGTPPYTYFWNELFSNDSLQTELPPGTYTYTVRDANNCESSNEVTIGQVSSAAELPEAVGNWHVFPNPTSGRATVEMRLLEAAPYELTLRDALGRTVQQQTGVGRETNRTFDLSGLPTGAYQVTLWLPDAAVLRSRRLLLVR